MIIVGITGSIGCGKTTIANTLRKQGELVWDVDKWVKFLYYKKDFLNNLKEIFPEAFANNQFNKRCLRNIVFNDNNKLKILENIIHPYLENKFRKIIRKNAKNNYLAFIDIALLFEMGWDRYCDYIVLADVDKEVQIKRVMLRDGISRDDFEKIDKIQMSQDKKKKMVDFVIDTNIDIDKLKLKIINLLEELK